MSGFRNVYRRGDLLYLGRAHAARKAADAASAAELRAEPRAVLVGVATDLDPTDWEAELRQLGRIVGINDPDASAEVIGDALTSERDTLRETLRNVARGPTRPPPDPAAHSWKAYAGFWYSEAQRTAALARLALSYRESSHAV